MVAFDYKKTPITQIADYIIMYSSKSGASDIHFDPRDNGLMVRIRIDGELQDYTLIPPDYERNLTTRLKLLANMNITESRLKECMEISIWICVFLVFQRMKEKKSLFVS